MKRLALLLMAGCATTAPAVKQTPLPPSKPQCATAPPKSPGDARALLGRTVEKVCVVGADEKARAGLERAVDHREGKPLTAAAVAEDLELLFTAGSLRDAVAVAEPFEPNGAVLTYFVTGYPRVTSVRFEGNAALTRAELAELAPLDSRASPAVIAAMKNAITRRYRELGYEGLTLTTTGDEALVFTLVEGPRTLVQAVRFVGAKQVTEAELKKALPTTLGYPFRVAQKEADLVALTTLYMDHGLATVNVKAEAQPLPRQPNALEVVFTIEEGPLFRLGTLKLGGVELDGAPALLKSLESKQGSVFSRAALRRDIAKVQEHGAKKGVKVDVVPLTDVDAKKKTIDVELRLERKEGGAPPAF